MKKFSMEHVGQIERMLGDGKRVEIEWHVPYERMNHVGIVTDVRWDGLVFTEDGAVFTGLDYLVGIRALNA